MKEADLFASEYEAEAKAEDFRCHGYQCEVEKVKRKNR